MQTFISMNKYPLYSTGLKSGPCDLIDNPLLSKIENVRNLTQIVGTQNTLTKVTIMVCPFHDWVKGFKTKLLTKLQRILKYFLLCRPPPVNQLEYKN